jgi:hypothetical protein
MMIAPEDKYVMERYCDVAEKFMKIVDYYVHATKEERAYMDSCFEKKFQTSFGAYFRPLIERKPKARTKGRK